MPPLQILPVAANHCRVGLVLAKLLSTKLAEPREFPSEIVFIAENYGLVIS